MKRKIKDKSAKLFRPNPHRMERRMKKGYAAAAAVNTEEAALNCDAPVLLEYEKWLLTQPQQQSQRQTQTDK